MAHILTPACDMGDAARSAVASSVCTESIDQMSVRAVRAACVPPCPVPFAIQHVLAMRHGTEMIWIDAGLWARRAMIEFEVIWDGLSTDGFPDHDVGCASVPMRIAVLDATVPIVIAGSLPEPTRIGISTACHSCPECGGPHASSSSVKRTISCASSRCASSSARMRAGSRMPMICSMPRSQPWR